MKLQFFTGGLVAQFFYRFFSVLENRIRIFKNKEFIVWTRYREVERVVKYL